MRLVLTFALMKYDALDKIPARIDVSGLLGSRYEAQNHERPLSWDERVEGIDVVVTVEGRTIKLLSDGQQAPPQRGWGLIITGGDSQKGYRWTLYSLPKGSEIPSGPRV